MWLVHMHVPTTPLLSYFVYCAAIPNEEGELNILEKFRWIPRGNQDGRLKPGRQAWDFGKNTKTTSLEKSFHENGFAKFYFLCKYRIASGTYVRIAWSLAYCSLWYNDMKLC